MQRFRVVFLFVFAAGLTVLAFGSQGYQDPVTNIGAQAVAPPQASESNRAFVDYTDPVAFGAAAGSLNTITFTEVPVGTVLSNQYPGVDFFDGNDQTIADSGFVNDGIGAWDGGGSPEQMTIVFDQPILAFGVHFPGAARIDIYDAPGGTLIYQSSEFGGAGLGFFGGVVSTTTPFTTVVLSDWFLAPGYYDDLVYGEPATAAGTVMNSWPSGLGAAWGVAYDGLNNTVWVSSPGPNWGGTSTLYEYTPAGAPTGRSHPYTWSPLNGPGDVAFDWNTNTMWVMNINSGVSNCLYEMDPTTGYTGQTICPGGPAGWTNSQRGLAFDPITDTFYAGGWNETVIYHIDMAGNDVEPPVAVGLAISGLAYNPATQHLFVMVNASPTEIFVLDASAGYALVNQFSISQDFGANAGAGLEIDCVGKLWAVDQTTQGVYQIESDETANLCGPLFIDGFESGDTSAWSATVP